MLIGFIHPRYPSAEGSGAIHSATQIANALAESEHTLDVYCPHDPSEADVSPTMNLHHLSGHSNHPHRSTRLNREIRARSEELSRYDVVHSYVTPVIPSLARIGAENDVRTVVTLNAFRGICAKNDLLYLDEEQCTEKSVRKCLECIVRTGFTDDESYARQAASQLFSLRLVEDGERRLEHIDAFQALSDHIEERYTQFGFPGEAIEVVPIILDSRFLIEHRSDFTEPYRLLYVGSLDKHKGVEMLPKIFSRLESMGEFDFEATVVGDGSLKSHIEAECAEPGLSSKVSFTGHLSNESLPGVYANHDLFLYPGIWDEAFGRVFLEALAAGTPVVGTNVGSVRSITGDAGVVTEPDPDALAEKIRAVVTSGALTSMAESTTVEARRFTKDRVVESLVELYEMESQQ